MVKIVDNNQSGWFGRLGSGAEASFKRSAHPLSQPLHPEARAIPRFQGHVEAKRIGFFGFFGSGNFGNDGSLEVMVEFVKKARPRADLLCICDLPADVESRLGIRSIRINWRPESRFLRGLDRLVLNIPSKLASLVHAIRHVSRLDALIVPGTGILDDYGTGPQGMPQWLLRWCVLARIFGTKVIFVSVGAGPIHHPLSRWLMKTASRMAVYRSYRDNISKDYMSSIGVDVHNDPVYPDVAFALPQPLSLPQPCAEGDPITVGLGIMSYNGWRGDKACDEAVYESYLHKLQRFVCWLLAEGHRVRILMGDSYDQSTVEKLYQMIETDRSEPGRADVIAEPAYSLHEVMAQIAATDIVMATRFHNVVCALKLGRPTLSIGYARKNDVLLDEMGLGEFCQHIEQLDVDVLIKQFRKLTASRKTYERKICETNSIYADSLRHQYALLLDKYL